MKAREHYLASLSARPEECLERLAGIASLLEHVKEYEVDIMNLQRAEALVPGEAGGYHEVRLANGAVMKAKTVILSTGARWDADAES